MNDLLRHQHLALRAAGIGPADADELLRHTAAAVAPGPDADGTWPRLGVWLDRERDRIGRGRLERLLDDLATAQVRGPPAGPTRDVWEVLFGHGCPLDHLWRTLYHCCKDPDSDPQDRAWVPRELAVANARRYVELRFPRASGPWPGLGCEETAACVAARFTTFVAYPEVVSGFMLLQELRRLRQVCSTGLLCRIDDEVGLPAKVRDGMLQGEWDPTAPPLLFEHVEEVGREPVVHLVASWIAAFEATEKLVDLGRDRFVRPAEWAAPPALRLREVPAPPDGATVRALVAEVAAWSGQDAEDLFERKLHVDPLHWLEEVVQARP